ncbi:Rid family hydrolase [Photobacterium lucens]|uniref:Rid family hydrolase n=1 Tax=Photobacterium lucens TaxID=2562949 RepID=UPI00136A0C1E|nr:Rid family hydrolase [Photobacterium lucens]MBP2699589.1 RidA family protein [Vibrio parahaemolyticus]MZG56892.1 RidA family protein [Photobacterium lucens]MZG81653.1 RidA family protein [Photobacterium lucens]
MKTVIVPEAFQHYVDDWHFTPVVESDGTVYLSGITAARADKPISRDPEEQFHDAFFKLGIYLEAAGLTFDDILEMTTYHINLKLNIDTFSKVKDEYIKPPYPAWSAIGVAEFIPENALVEMRIVAKRPQ